MLSVILYGRNDSHGYNLHRRAALSLNCIAETLTASGDEIVFVDYNTPDELPTFPEAIDDCLTEKTKKLLRIIRVRPSWHRPLGERTRLVALEPQSRNIAIRRCNPENRWILSTNTDMIFIPKIASGSLSDTIEALDDGFYHLPRLELPEGLWERLDRRDPKGALKDVAASAPRFHLDEIVYGGYDNLYEAPGDFQLFLRDDLFGIDGFDERMILGWHVDSNIARRMRILRGEVKSASNVLRGYHCGHSRQPTTLHAANRTQNDLHTFVDAVTEADCPAQRDVWGAPETAFEELRLDGSTVRTYRKALGAATAEPQKSDYTVRYNGETFGSPVLNAEHALTHLCDLLFNMPPGQKLFVLASDPLIGRGLVAFLNIAAPSTEVVFAKDLSAPQKSSIGKSARNVRWMVLDEALAYANAFVIQYPCADEKPGDDLRDQQWLAQSVFHRVAEEEAGRPVSERRRVITVNAIHSPMEKVVVSTISHAAAPFTTRLRQGFVQRPFDRRSNLDPREAVFEETGRVRPYTDSERALLGRVITSLETAKSPVQGWQRLAPELRALARHPKGAELLLGRRLLDPEKLAAKADEAIAIARARASGEVAWVDGRPDILTRLISGQDWEDARWLAFAERFFASESLYDLPHRSRWIWERVSLTLGLHAALNYRSRPWVLLVSPGADVLALLLANSGFRVAYSTQEEFLAGRPVKVRDWVKPAIQSGIRVITPSDLRPLDEVLDRVERSGGFSAMVAPVGTIFEGGAAHADRLLARASPLMGPNAVLACGTLVHLNGSADGGALTQLEWRNLFHAFGPLGSRGFKAIAPPDTRVPEDTIARFAFEDKAAETIGGLSFGFGAGFVAPAILAAHWPSELSPGAGREAALEALAPTVVEPAIDEAPVSEHATAPPPSKGQPKASRPIRPRGSADAADRISATSPDKRTAQPSKKKAGPKRASVSTRRAPPLQPPSRDPARRKLTKSDQEADFASDRTAAPERAETPKDGPVSSRGGGARKAAPAARSAEQVREAVAAPKRTADRQPGPADPAAGPSISKPASIETVAPDRRKVDPRDEQHLDVALSAPSEATGSSQAGAPNAASDARTFKPTASGLNLQPFVTAGSARIVRTPVGLTISGASSLRLALRLDLSDVEYARFKIRLDVEPSGVTWEPDQGRALAVRRHADATGTVLEFAGVGALGRGTLVISLDASEARISQFVSL